jgi:hypothetical protein
MEYQANSVISFTQYTHIRQLSTQISLSLSLCLSSSHNRLHESKRITWKRICTFELASICTFVPDNQHRPALLQQPYLSLAMHTIFSLNY